VRVRDIWATLPAYLRASAMKWSSSIGRSMRGPPTCVVGPWATAFAIFGRMSRAATGEGFTRGGSFTATGLGGVKIAGAGRFETRAVIVERGACAASACNANNASATATAEERRETERIAKAPSSHTKDKAELACAVRAQHRFDAVEREGRAHGRNKGHLLARPALRIPRSRLSL
jgi:hypothetical protein